jgi:hypothetical protein
LQCKSEKIAGSGRAKKRSEGENGGLRLNFGWLEPTCCLRDQAKTEMPSVEAASVRLAGNKARPRLGGFALDVLNLY